MEYPEFYPGTYYTIGAIVKVTPKNSLFKAKRSFTATAIPSENTYWSYVGPIPVDPNALTLEKLDARLKIVEAKVNAAPTPTPIPVTGYLSFPKSSPISINGVSGKVYENIMIEGAIAATLTNCSDIIFRNCTFLRSSAELMTLQGCRNILVEKCLMGLGTTGVYAASSQGVRVINNQFYNIRQRINTDGSKARGQFIQFNTVTGAGNEISGNRGENFFGESDPEDMISLFKSSGTAASPILVKNNLGRGGGPSTSGGGIVAGDNGGDYIVIDSNQLVNPGNYGVAIAGGNNNVLNGNRVYSDFHTWNNAGVIIWAQGVGITGSNVTYTNNHVNWPYKMGGQNNVFNNGNMGPVIETGNVYNESLDVMMPNFPKHLIDFITSEELLAIRK